MNIDINREINITDTEASDGNIVNNKWNEFTDLKSLQQNLVTPLLFDCVFSGNLSFSMTSLWREVRNIFQYLIRNHLLLEGILVFQIWCLASVKQMGFSIRSF